jgi:hypothetical protein
MVYNTRNYKVYGLGQSSGILNTREHNVSETDLFQSSGKRGENTYSSKKPGPRYLYSCSYTNLGCPVIEVSSF